MKKGKHMKNIKFTLLCIFLLSICVFLLSSCGTAGNDHITVKKTLSTKLSNYYKVLVENPQDLDMDYSPYFLLSNKGLKVSRTKKGFDPDLRVVVNGKEGIKPPGFRYQTPIPTFGKGLSTLSYTFIEHKSNEIIGVVTYSRPFYKTPGTHIPELMFQKITEFKPGLTDFNEWSTVTMKESRIAIELPKSFSDYSDSSDKDNTSFLVHIQMHRLADSYYHGLANSLLDIRFEKQTKEKYIDEMKRELEYAPPEYKDSKQKKWETTFHSDFSKSENLLYNDFNYEYRKDYEVAGGYVIRVHATRFKNIPNASIVEDEKAIRRIMESLQVLDKK